MWWFKKDRSVADSGPKEPAKDWWKWKRGDLLVKQRNRGVHDIPFAHWCYFYGWADTNDWTAIVESATLGPKGPKSSKNPRYSKIKADALHLYRNQRILSEKDQKQQESIKASAEESILNEYTQAFQRALEEQSVNND